MVRGDVGVIQQLEENWDAVAMQTVWKLEPVYMYVNTENQEHNNGTENLQANLQPITNSNNENIDGVCTNH